MMCSEFFLLAKDEGFSSGALAGAGFGIRRIFGTRRNRVLLRPGALCEMSDRQYSVFQKTSYRSFLYVRMRVAPVGPRHGVTIVSSGWLAALWARPRAYGS